MAEILPVCLAAPDNPALTEDRKIALLGALPRRERLIQIRQWWTGDVISAEQTQVLIALVAPADYCAEAGR